MRKFKAKDFIEDDYLFCQYQREGTSSFMSFILKVFKNGTHCKYIHVEDKSYHIIGNFNEKDMLRQSEFREATASEIGLLNSSIEKNEYDHKYNPKDPKRKHDI
jgi:hypothetical protein